MWRWSTIVVLILLQKYISSQPITDDHTNERSTRQLDFEECCPCFDKSDVHGDGGSEEPEGAASEGVLSRSRDMGDCPCRDRETDAQGASSVFLPTAMRAAGTFLRPGEKKEDLKPLFNPEVDLASSVLQTLREVTDEEYQDALARDAAKSAAKAAEDILVGDAIPQESANIVTIVVNPSLVDEDDAIPQASHIQQARCIHPLQSSVSKMRMAPKSNLFVYKPRLPRTKSVLFHNSFDNGMGASNVHEHIVSPNEDTGARSTDTSPLRVLESLKSTFTNTDGNESCKENETESTPSAEKNKIFGLNRSPLLQSIKNKIDGSLSRTPTRLRNLLSDKARTDADDLSSASSVISELTTKRVPYFRKNSPLENIKQKTRPLSITNLLNLKDVELIPPKDLIKKAAVNKINKPKFIVPSVRDNDERSSRNDAVETISRQHSEFIPENISTGTSASNFGERTNIVNNHASLKDDREVNTDCEEGMSEWQSVTTKNAKQDDLKHISIEIVDTPSGIKDQLSKEAASENNDCIDDLNAGQDTIANASNNINNVIEQQEENQESDTKLLEDQKSAPEESCDEENKNTATSKSSTNSIENQSQFKLLDPNLVDKTISNIKENIAKNLENLKNFKSSITNKDLFNREVVNNSGEDSKLIPASRDENVDDCQDEASMTVTTLSPQLLSDNSEDVTTLSPVLLDNSENIESFKSESSDNLEDIKSLEPVNNRNTEDATECLDKVSLQDLQKLSDAMLQQEEQDRKGNSECVIIESSQNNNVESFDSDKSADTLTNVIEDTTRSDNFRENNDENIGCRSDFVSLNNSPSARTDANGDASEIIIESVSKPNDILSSRPILQPTQNDIKSSLPDVNNFLKLPPLHPSPIIEDIKVKLSNLFDKNDKNIEDLSPIKPKMMMTVQQDTPNPVMTPAASTDSFQSRVPFAGLLSEGNLRKLDTRPPSHLLPDIPKFGLNSYNTKLPLPKDISLKPIRLQSGHDDKQRLLSAQLLTGDNINSKVINKNNKATGTFNNQLTNVDNAWERLSDLPQEATSRFHSTLKNTQKAFESRLRQFGNNKPSLLGAPIKSTSLLESLSRNHEDISDKLKGLHIDLNDRLETMRNELIDRSRLLIGGSRNSKPSFSDIAKKKKTKQPLKHTWQASSRTDSPKIPTLRKPAQHKPLKGLSSSKTSKQHTFRMPGAASVPVPSTIQVPQLKTASESSTPLNLQQSSNTLSKWKAGVPRTLKMPNTVGTQISNSQSTSTLLTKPFNTKKDNKIIVTFSTTPRPAMLQQSRSSSTHLRNSNIGKNDRELGSWMVNEDFVGSPSEVNKIQAFAPVSAHRNKQTINIEHKEDKLIASEIEDLSEKSTLQSWPRATESSFLSKVKEAVQTRLSKVKSPKSLKQNHQGNDGISVIEVQEPKFEMTGAASENKEIVDNLTLKENVSYKCKMVCTRE